MKEEKKKENNMTKLEELWKNTFYASWHYKSPQKINLQSEDGRLIHVYVDNRDDWHLEITDPATGQTESYADDRLSIVHARGSSLYCYIRERVWLEDDRGYRVRAVDRNTTLEIKVVLP